MRLTCPNCGAQYEVPETAIPEAGRDVQCAACGEAWVQHRPGAASSPNEHGPAKPEDASAQEPQAAPAQRRLDPEVADILRAEAARERAQRAAEATGAADPAPREPSSDPSAAPSPQPSPEPPLQGATRAIAAAATAPAPLVSPKTTLPDPEDINASLTQGGRASRDGVEEPLATSVPDTRSGFAAGFWVAVIVFGLAAGVYLGAPELVELVPEAEAPIERYVAAVDAARLRLDALVDRMMAQITGG
ncbi:MAG: zinc-ribbon domain-containing protein [Roseovarius sp.]